MAGVELRVGARVLTGAIEILSGASHNSKLATVTLTDGMRLQGAMGLRSGAEAVRSMGGSFFERFADDMLVTAQRVQDGGPTGPAIHQASEAVGWLYARASNMR